MIEIEGFREIVEELLEEIPTELFEELNGGVRVLPECEINLHALNDDLITLREYHHSAVMVAMLLFIMDHLCVFLKIYQEKN